MKLLMIYTNRFAYRTSQKALDSVPDAEEETQITGALLAFILAEEADEQNAADVAWIEKDMVGTAQWIQENLPSDTLLAVHDIGAIGYFDQHPVIDLAGLVSPDVVPFIRDQDQIAAYLDRRDADFLVTLADFYPGRQAFNNCALGGTDQAPCAF